MVRAFESRANRLLRINAKKFFSIAWKFISDARSACCNSELDTDEIRKSHCDLVPWRNRVK